MTESSLFEQFSGADLDRLIECIQKIRSEGLTLDKQCHAGVNPNSGNVYIYSEDWAGCVYCTIGLGVSWSYSCLECGEEFDFDTEAECRTYVEKHNYKCETCHTND